MDIELLEQWKELMYENGRSRWPGLTPKEFGDAARAVIAQLPAEGASLEEFAKCLEVEIRKSRGGDTDAANTPQPR